MNDLNFASGDIFWIGSDLDPNAHYHQPDFVFLTDHAMVVGELKRANVELSQTLAVPEPPQVAIRGAEYFYWLSFSSGMLAESNTLWVATADMLEEWHQWWRRDRALIERLQETLGLLRRLSRLLRRAIRLLVRPHIRPDFHRHISRSERVWLLLHGAHPPREDAGKCRPAFAEPGRVCCGWVG